MSKYLTGVSGIPKGSINSIFIHNCATLDAFFCQFIAQCEHHLSQDATSLITISAFCVFPLHRVRLCFALYSFCWYFGIDGCQSLPHLCDGEFPMPQVVARPEARHTYTLCVLQAMVVLLSDVRLRNQVVKPHKHIGRASVASGVFMHLLETCSATFLNSVVEDNDVSPSHTQLERAANVCSLLARVYVHVARLLASHQLRGDDVMLVYVLRCLPGFLRCCLSWLGFGRRSNAQRISACVSETLPLTHRDFLSVLFDGKQRNTISEFQPPNAEQRICADAFVRVVQLLPGCSQLVCKEVFSTLLRFPSFSHSDFFHSLQLPGLSQPSMAHSNGFGAVSSFRSERMSFRPIARKRFQGCLYGLVESEWRATRMCLLRLLEKVLSPSSRSEYGLTARMLLRSAKILVDGFSDDCHMFRCTCAKLLVQCFDHLNKSGPSLLIAARAVRQNTQSHKFIALESVVVGLMDTAMDIRHCVLNLLRCAHFTDVNSVLEAVKSILDAPLLHLDLFHSVLAVVALGKRYCSWFKIPNVGDSTNLFDAVIANPDSARAIVQAAFGHSVLVAVPELGDLFVPSHVQFVPGWQRFAPLYGMQKSGGPSNIWLRDSKDSGTIPKSVRALFSSDDSLWKHHDVMRLFSDATQAANVAYPYPFYWDSDRVLSSTTSTSSCASILSSLISSHHKIIVDSCDAVYSFVCVLYFGFILFAGLRKVSSMTHISCFLKACQHGTVEQTDFTSVLCMYLLAHSQLSAQEGCGRAQVLALACRLRFGFVWPSDAETTIRVAFQNLHEYPPSPPSAVQVRSLLLYLETALCVQTSVRQHHSSLFLPTSCTASISLGTPSSTTSIYYFHNSFNR